MTRSRKLADIAAAYAAGNPLSFRNRIINGSAIIGQRGVVNVTTTTPAYGTDRMLAGVVAGTGINVNLFKSSFGGSSSGLAHYITGSFTNGTPYWAQRIEAQNCQDLNSQWVTVSGLLYHDAGSTLNFTPRLSKAPSVDSFAGATAIATNANVSVPSGVVTPFTTRFQLGSTDASNGLMFEMFLAGTATVTGKNFCITDLQLEKGVIQTLFENRFVGFELALSQRYYQQWDYSAALGSGGATALPATKFSNTDTILATAGTNGPMRATPTVTSSNSSVRAIFNTAQTSATISGLAINSNGAGVLMITCANNSLAAGFGWIDQLGIIKATAEL